MTEREIILESELEQAKNRENDHKNCANCKFFIIFERSTDMIKPCCKNTETQIIINPHKVCSKHEWDKMERMERSYD